MNRSAKHSLALLAVLVTAPAIGSAAPGIVNTVASGWSVDTVALPASAEFQGVVGNHATNADVIVITYKVGSVQTIAKVTLSTGTVTPLLVDSTGTLTQFVGGAALLSDTVLVWAENGDNAAPPAEDIFIATDGDSSGTFTSGEVVSLSSLGANVDDATGQANFTATKLRVVTAPAPAGLVAGDVLFQTADDDFLTVPIEPSEIVAIRGLGTASPAFIPTPGVGNAAWFRGTGATFMVYDGGFGFGPSGSTIVSSLQDDFATTRLMAARDTDASGSIEPSESVVLGNLSLGGGVDLGVTTSGAVVSVSGGNIALLTITGDPLSGGSISAASDIVETSSFFLAGGTFNTNALPFAAGGNPATSAAFVFADFAGTELYVLRPSNVSSVDGWTAYN